MPLSLSDLVRVTSTLKPTTVVRREFGRTIYFHAPTLAAAATKEVILRDTEVRAYSNVDSVAEDHPSGEVREASDAYFGQDFFPKNLLTGPIYPGGRSGYVFGTEVAAIADIGALTDAATTVVTFAGVTTAAIDLTAPTDLATLATALQTAFAAALSNTEVAALADGTLQVTVPAGTDISGGFSVSAGSGPTVSVAIGEALGLVGTGVIIRNAVEATATILTELDRVQFEETSYSIIVPSPVLASVQANAEAFDSWVSTRNYMLIMDVLDPAVLVTGETTSFTYGISQLESERTFGIYSAHRDYKSMAVAAIASSINFRQADALLTLKWKQLNRTTPDNLTLTQTEELNRKRINYYASYGTEAFLVEGWTYGAWYDARAFLDWFVNEVQSSAVDLFKRSRKVPQSNAGMTAILSTVTQVCERGVLNGGLIPETVRVSIATREDIRRVTQNTDYDGLLRNGYLVYGQPIAIQTQAERDTRMSAPVFVWLKGSGAIHDLDAAIVFEN